MAKVATLLLVVARGNTSAKFGGFARERAHRTSTCLLNAASLNELGGRGGAISHMNEK